MYKHSNIDDKNRVSPRHKGAKDPKPKCRVLWSAGASYECRICNIKIEMSKLRNEVAFKSNGPTFNERLMNSNFKS